MTLHCQRAAANAQPLPLLLALPRARAPALLRAGCAVLLRARARARVRYRVTDGTTVKIRPICNSSLILKFPFTPRIYFTTQSDCEVSSKVTVAS